MNYKHDVIDTVPARNPTTLRDVEERTLFEGLNIQDTSFFDKILFMAEEKDLCENRLACCKRSQNLHGAWQICEISKASRRAAAPANRRFH